MLAGEMRDGHFNDAHPAGFELLHEFDANRTAGRTQLRPLDQRAADEPKIAIDIAELYAEKKTGKLVINRANGDPMPRVVPTSFVAVDEADVGPDRVEKRWKFTHIVLPIAIGVKYEILRSRLKTGAKRATVAAIFRMGDHPEARAMHFAQALQHGSGFIGAAIVDDDDFEITGVPFEYGKRFFDQPR